MEDLDVTYTSALNPLYVLPSMGGLIRRERCTNASVKQLNDGHPSHLKLTFLFHYPSVLRQPLTQSSRHAHTLIGSIASALNCAVSKHQHWSARSTLSCAPSPDALPAVLAAVWACTPPQLGLSAAGQASFSLAHFQGTRSRGTVLEPADCESVRTPECQAASI